MSPFEHYFLRSKKLKELSNRLDTELNDKKNEMKLQNKKQNEIHKAIKPIIERYKNQLKPTDQNGTTMLADGWSADCMVWVREDYPQKEEARKFYMEEVSRVKEFKLPEELELDSPPRPLLPGWIMIEVFFTLETPWYSKDDRLLHVLDNPLRKDRVFGVPYMSAAAWKGLLRWSCRMYDGMIRHLEEHSFSLEEWVEKPWILHLFGNQKDEDEFFLQGSLFFYPTWFSKISYEVINPHSRETRAGTQPIYYEVVPSDTSGVLRIMYAPFPDQVEKDEINPVIALESLFESIQLLLTVYGFSAKRSTGWGKAKITNWKLTAYNYEEKEATTIDGLKDFLREHLSDRPTGVRNHDKTSRNPM